jgi:formamidopyrimidine-DNA glycosylase
MIHLKMTGQLVFVADTDRFGAGHPNDSLIHQLPDNSTRVTLGFLDGARLFFNDQRKFGWMKLYPTAEVPNVAFMQKVGPEPLEDTFTADIFYERLQRRKNTTIKAAILDQTVLAGVGNIYADEGLWGARVHPATRVKDVPRQKILDLYRELREVMTLAIEKGGSSNHTYINADGKKGMYMDFARVFRREGQACPRHPDVEIEKLKVAGRGTHICPVCQVLA